MIDALAGRSHDLAHLLPIWEAFPAEHRGTLYVGGALVGTPQAEAAGAVPKSVRLQAPGPRVLVASQLDYQHVATHRRVIFGQHGAGQSYGGDSDPGVSRASSYAGGDNQDRTDLFLVPGPHPAQRCRDRYPHIPVAEIGCPALDRWLADPPRPANRDPIVALAWHWENPLCPETRTALPHFRSALGELADRYTVIGHAHPRAKRFLEPVYEMLGIPWATYETVMERADVLVVDNSSIGWEFAATGRPVVWLTPPWYRDIDHGIRFGPDFNARPHLAAREPWQLPSAVADAVLAYGRVHWIAARWFPEVGPDAPLGYGVPDVSHVYTYTDGLSAERAAVAIVALEEENDMALAEVSP